MCYFFTVSNLHAFVEDKCISFARCSTYAIQTVVRTRCSVLRAPSSTRSTSCATGGTRSTVPSPPGCTRSMRFFTDILLLERSGTEWRRRTDVASICDSFGRWRCQRAAKDWCGVSWCHKVIRQGQQCSWDLKSSTLRDIRSGATGFEGH